MFVDRPIKSIQQSFHLVPRVRVVSSGHLIKIMAILCPELTSKNESKSCLFLLDDNMIEENTDQRATARLNVHVGNLSLVEQFERDMSEPCNSREEFDLTRSLRPSWTSW